MNKDIWAKNHNERQSNLQFHPPCIYVFLPWRHLLGPVPNRSTISWAGDAEASSSWCLCRCRVHCGLHHCLRLRLRHVSRQSRDCKKLNQALLCNQLENKERRKCFTYWMPRVCPSSWANSQAFTGPALLSLCTSAIRPMQWVIISVQWLNEKKGSM